MTNILSLDTSTDACSAALRIDSSVSHRSELVPRQHNHLLFNMLRELLPDQALSSAGLDVIAYAHGPGSFTGLRVAASAVQGLAYALDLPVVGVSTLACLAQGALHRRLVAEDDTVLAMLDARINEIYWGLYRFENQRARVLVADAVGAPGELPGGLLQDCGQVVALGSGLVYFDELPAAVRSGVARRVDDQWPDSVDLLPLVDDAVARGALLSAAEVQPVYLRNEIHWKKLSEQG